MRIDRAKIAMESGAKVAVRRRKLDGSHPGIGSIGRIVSIAPMGHHFEIEFYSALVHLDDDTACIEDISDLALAPAIAT